jgi:hypothetical protein
VTADFDLTPGFYKSLPHSTYLTRRVGVVSKHALDLVNRSPAHYKSWADGAEEEDTPTFAFGRAFHCAQLEPDLFESTYCVEPNFGDCRKKENKAARDEWRAANAGKEVLEYSDLRAIRGMVDSVRRHPLASKMIADGEPELTLVWKDAGTGLMCKSRADYYVRNLGMVVDVKSTNDASYESFRKDIAKYRYMVQDALYRDGFAALDAPVKHFVFIAVEKYPPYAVAIYSLDADGVGRGYTYARSDIERLADCVLKDKWPAYDESIQTIELPPWA